jgi:putative membrane protein
MEGKSGDPMDRRSILLGVSAAAIASSALAQSRGPAPGPAPDMGKAETDHMQETMKIGSLALATSRIALQKAQDAQVKQFAQFEVAEQETIADVLKSMQGANVTTGQGAATNVEAQANLDDKGKATLKKLQDAKAGAAFDKEYVKAQTDGHTELLKVQENYIKAGNIREQINVAKLARGQVKEHLTLLQSIKV